MFELVQYYPMQSNISTKGETEIPNRLHLPQCQSTNDELQLLLKEDRDRIPEGFILSTGYQSAGKGQRGNRWESEPDQNLLFSLYLKPAFLEPAQAFRLSVAIALGVAQALEAEMPADSGNFRIKWPNDFFCGDRKLGGMLIETVFSGQRIDRAVCGIGLNVNQKFLPAGAVSLQEILGKEQYTGFLLQKIHSSLMTCYGKLKSGDWQSLRSAYLARLYRLATPAWYALPDGTRFQAMLKSVSDQGELILLCRDGEKKFRFKEVAFQF